MKTVPQSPSKLERVFLVQKLTLFSIGPAQSPNGRKIQLFFGNNVEVKVPAGQQPPLVWEAVFMLSIDELAWLALKKKPTVGDEFDFAFGSDAGKGNLLAVKGESIV